MMFIATMSGGVVSVALFVRTVLYRIGVPALTVLAVTSIDTCSWPVACAAGAACWGSAKAGDAPKARREASRNKAAMRALGPGRWRAFPASRRRAGPAYQNSRPKVRTANAKGDSSQDQALARVQLFTSKLARKTRGAASGFIHCPKSPIVPPWACPGNWVGRKNSRYRHRLTNRLVLFELHQKPTNIDKAVKASVRTHPKPAPQSTAWPNTSSPWDSTFM